MVFLLIYIKPKKLYDTIFAVLHIIKTNRPDTPKKPFCTAANGMPGNILKSGAIQKAVFGSSKDGLSAAKTRPFRP